MFTRRRLLLTLPALAVTRHLTAQSFLTPFHKKAPLPQAPTFVYFGTDTGKGISKGIYLSRFNSATGHLTPPQLVAETPRPVYFAVTPVLEGHRCLYAANEGSDAASSTISTFIIDAATGALKPLNQVSSGGFGPAYLSVDATGHSAFVADYGGSGIATYRILPNGALSDPVERIDYKSPKFGTRGPNAARQEAPHPHSARLSPDNRFLLVSDLGSDEISVFPVDAATGTLGAPALFSNDRPGSGPRHLVFHPNGRWVYSINELDSTIDHFLWTTTSSRTAPQGLLVKAGNGIKTVAASFPASGDNTGSEIEVSPDGHFVYASNRGENSLVVFAIAPADGSLTLIQRLPCGGKTPRQFTLSPDAHWLLCGNQNSASVTVFRRDGTSGRLSGPTESLSLDSPMMALFV